MTSLVFTLARPTSSCHSPLTDACICHDLTAPAPQHFSFDGQSAFVAHAVFDEEQVRGTVGVTGWSALFTTRSVSVTRTCTSGEVSRFQPARIVAAKPVGMVPCTGWERRTWTSRCGFDGSVSRRRIFSRAGVPPGVAYGITRQPGRWAFAGRGGRGRSKTKSWALNVATGCESG